MFHPKLGVKKDPIKRWNQPDRRFFACGACHILAHAFLELYPNSRYLPIWVKPAEGFYGNHVFVTDGKYTFDYHGYSTLNKFKNHCKKRNQMYYPNWSCEYVNLEVNLNSRETHEIGMHTITSTEFLHDALPRAREFVLHHQGRHIVQSDEFKRYEFR